MVYGDGYRGRPEVFNEKLTRALKVNSMQKLAELFWTSSLRRTYIYVSIIFCVFYAQHNVLYLAFLSPVRFWLATWCPPCIFFPSLKKEIGEIVKILFVSIQNLMILNRFSPMLLCLLFVLLYFEDCCSQRRAGWLSLPFLGSTWKSTFGFMLLED